MFTRRLLPLAGIALTIALLLALPARSANPDDAPAKIAIVNPVKVFQQCLEAKDMTERVSSNRKSLQEVANEKQQKLKDLQQQLQMLKPDKPEYTEKRQDLLKESIEYDVWTKENEADQASQQKQNIKSLFDKIQETVAQVANQKGISLVLSDQRPEIPDNLDKVDGQTLMAMIVQRSVLYADQKMDITQDVIVLMDKNYNDKH